jgi:tRNA A-37 threonylcarbamoyl transferase component Bud32
VSQSDLEQTLRNLQRDGTLLKDRAYRQVWRFEHEGRGYYLKFYPRSGFALKRLVRGNPAMREFTRLQWLQKAHVAAPHVRAVLVGFRIDEKIGDAVVIDAIEPGVQLDQHLLDLELRGAQPESYRALVDQVIEIVHALGKAGYGHSDLHLGNILLSEGKLFLLDGYAVHARGLRRRDVLMLGHSASRYCTKADLWRGWKLLGGGAMPARNVVSAGLYRKFLATTRGENAYFGRLDSTGGWRGNLFKRAKFPRPWSSVSRMQIAPEDWQREWPNLLARIESDQLTIIKRSPSGDVLEGEITLGGRPIHVIVKRPRKKFWHRYFTTLFRAGRAQRTWTKAWKIIVRNIPCEWPLIVMEKHALGYVTDSIIVLEKMQGQTLATMDLNALEAANRELLFRRLGRTLRRLELLGFTHFDAKSTNWIIRDDPASGPTPIMIDIDGVRNYVWTGEGIRRLLRSMKDHPHYTPEDSLALCRGYAPRAQIVREDDSISREGEAPAEPFLR